MVDPKLGGREQSTDDDAPRIGVDLGHHETRIVLPPVREGGRDTVLRFPTVVGYSRAEAAPIEFSCAGARALERRDHLRLVKPLELSEAEGRDSMRDFARHLRKRCGRRWPEGAWAVINCSPTATPDEQTLRRVFAGELFDRFLLADDTFLLALGLGSQEISSRSVVVDFGETSIGAAQIRGREPMPEERVEVPFAGASVSKAFEQSFRQRYPELLLTDQTLKDIKEALSFTSPEERELVLKIEFRGAEKEVDVTDLVQAACQRVLPPLGKAIRSILAKCPSDEVETFQKNIVLAGGGASIPGLAQHLEADLRADGFEQARIYVPDDPTVAVALGAACWGRLLPEKEWGIPLFSIGG